MEEFEFYEQLENFLISHQNLYGPKIYTVREAEINNDTDRPGQSNAPAVSSVTAKAAKPAAKTVSAAPQPNFQPKNELDKFYLQIRDCTKCELSKSRRKFVFGAGNPNAKLMFIGEAPGKDEDLQGIPFVGRAGQLLTLMLKAIGIEREEVFIANVLKCRPPNNRDPLPAEIEQCEPHLLKQIELISPELIVALGRYSGTLLLKEKMSLGEMRKSIHKYNQVPLIVTYHPAALLRTPTWKKDAWEDLKKVRSFLENAS